MNNEYVISMARRLEQDYGWNSNCAQPFAAFLCETNENNINGTPTLYSMWCGFIIAVHKLPRNQQPSSVDLTVVLEQVAGWGHNGDSIRYLKSEYKKGLLLLDYHKHQVY